MIPDSPTPAPPLPDDAIWVVDPHSGKQVNVSPFLRALHDFEPEPGQRIPRGAQALIQQVLRFLGGIVHDFQTTDAVELANVHDELWRLWDLFENTKSQPDQAL